MQRRPTTQQLAAWRALKERFPAPSGWALVYQCFALVFSNAYLAWLAFDGQATPLSLAAFNICELVMLSLIGRVELITIPRKARVAAPPQGGFFGQLFIWTFMLIWLTGVYAFCLMGDLENLALVARDHDVLDILARLNILWPLLLSAALAVSSMIGDWQLWHRRGGLFVPEMALPIVPKMLTLFLAPIPSMMTFFTVIDYYPDDIAVFSWCVAYLVIKCLMEFGMLIFQVIGMRMLDTLPSAR